MGKCVLYIYLWSKISRFASVRKFWSNKRKEKKLKWRSTNAIAYHISIITRLRGSQLWSCEWNELEKKIKFNYEHIIYSIPSKQKQKQTFKKINMNDSNSILYMLIHHMHFTVFVRIKEIVKSITNEHFSSNVVLAFVMQSKSSKNMHVRRNWDEKKKQNTG